ncbi:MAG: hypothetical protein HY319_12850 [Armatimonadetes bacterium]|nr:hypothetical protein [Armatimonadota bacterium]
MLRDCAPPGTTLTLTAAGPQPPGPDRSEVSASGAGSGTQNPTVRRSLARRLLRWAGWSGLAATGLVGATGTLGYLANQEALSEAPTVQLALDLETQLNRSPAPPGLTPAPIQSPAPAAATPAVPSQAPASPEGGVAVLVPASMAADLVRDLQRRPEVESLIERRLDEVAATVNSELATVRPTGGQLLLDLELPLPTGDQAFMHVGRLDLPSLGYRALQRERVPLSLQVELDPVETGLKLDVQRLRSAHPVRPASLEGPGIYLGAVRVRLLSEKEAIPLRGEAKLGLDLDGKSTAPMLARLEQRPAAATPGSEEARKLGEQLRTLQGRQQQARRLREIGAEGDQGYRDLLEDAFRNQTVSFDLRVRPEQGPLAEAVFHLWLGQDVTGDGRSDLHVAHQLDLERLANLSLEVRQLDRQGELPEGWLRRLANEQVQKHFVQGIRETVSRAGEQLRQEAVRRAEQELGRAIPRVVEHGNAELEQLYRRGGGIELPTASPVTSEARLSLAGFRLSGTGSGAVLVVDFDGATAARPETAALPAGMRLEPGELAVSLSGGELNRQLGPGGVVRWDQMLEQVNRQDGPYRASLARDPSGRTIYPRWSSEGKNPALVFDLQLDRKPAPAGEKVSIQRLLSSVGPAQLQRRVVVPLQLRVEQGDIHVAPLIDSVRIEKPGPDLSLRTRDLVPTEALTSLVARTVLAAEGGQAQVIRLGAPLRDYGLEVREIGTLERSETGPSLVVKLKTHPRAAEKLADLSPEWLQGR